MDFINSYLYTTIFALILLFIMIIITIIIDYKAIKIIKIKHVTYSAMIIAFSSSLNIVSIYISKIILPHNQIRIGDPLLMVGGLLFGPALGMIIAFCSDIIVFLIASGGVYHVGFTVSLCIYGFLGSIPFLSKTNRFWYSKYILLFTISIFLVNILLNSIFLYSFISSFYTLFYILLWHETIKTLIEYIPFLLILNITTKISLYIVKKSFYGYGRIWATRKDDVLFYKHKFKNKQVKLKQIKNLDNKTNLDNNKN